MKKTSPLLKRKLINLLIIVLLGYAFLFLYYFIRLMLMLYQRRGEVEINASIIKEIVIEVVMFTLSGIFAYICFRIRKNIKY